MEAGGEGCAYRPFSYMWYFVAVSMDVKPDEALEGSKSDVLSWSERIEVP